MFTVNTLTFLPCSFCCAVTESQSAVVAQYFSKVNIEKIVIQIDFCARGWCYCTNSMNINITASPIHPIGAHLGITQVEKGLDIFERIFVDLCLTKTVLLAKCLRSPPVLSPSTIAKDGSYCPTRRTMLGRTMAISQLVEKQHFYLTGTGQLEPNKVKCISASSGVYG